jgi:hypothetical protein
MTNCNDYNDYEILNAALAENLTQTLISIISAQEKLEELEKCKHFIRNMSGKKDKNIAKIKALLAGIQIGKQMLLNKAKSVYLFDNIEDLASNLTLNYKNSIENLISSSNTNQLKVMQAEKINKKLDKNNKISSYLNIVTSALQNQDGKASAASITKQINNNNNIDYESRHQDRVDACSVKCVSAYVDSNNEHKQASISPKKVTNEYAEFDIRYPPTKIDIFYPRAKINICSDTPQIDLNLPDPLIEYKSFSNENGRKNVQNVASALTNSYIDFNKCNDTTNKLKYSNIFHSYKPRVHLDSTRTDSFVSKPVFLHKNAHDDEKNMIRNASSRNSDNTVHKLKANSDMESRNSTINSSQRQNRSIENETENFIQTMINSGCESLLQHLLQRFIVLDNISKSGKIDKNAKFKEYNEWLKNNYSVDDEEATRIQTYIETWYVNCMMEKLDLSNK